MFKQQGLVVLVVVLSALWFAWTSQQVDTEEEKRNVNEVINNWKAQGSFFDYKGHKIFYIDKLNKEPVLLLIHGFPTSSWDFEHIIPNISLRYHVVTFDMLGFGLSDKPKKHDYKIVEQADIAQALLTKLEITEFHILAHDYGVSVAQELMARQQNKQKESEKFNILSVAFLNGGLFAHMHHPLFTQKLVANPIIGPYVHHVVGRTGFTSSMKKIFGTAHPPTKMEISTFWAFININDGLPNFHSLLGYMNDRREHSERWSRVVLKPDVPIRLINGPADPVSGRHLVEYYKSANEDTKLGGADILAHNIGHYPQVEDPEEVMRYLNIFWDKVAEYYAK